MKTPYILVVAKENAACYSAHMATMRCAHFEPNRTPETATAAAFAPAFRYVYSYYYAYTAMLEGRSSGE